MTARMGQAERLQSHGFGSNTVMALLLLVISVVGVVWIYLGMVAKDRWPIRWLEVDGVFQRVSAERVRIKVSPLVTASFFTVDLHNVQAQTAQLPWVAAVTVQKRWPDTVKVRIEEYTPVAHWSGGRLISHTGRAFMVPGADEIQGLPWLQGPEGTVAKVFEHWRMFNNELFNVGLEIERIELDRRGAWFLVLGNGTQVHIGREDTLARLQRMVASWPELVKLRPMVPVDIDLRYSNGLAVRWLEAPRELAANPG